VEGLKKISVLLILLIVVLSACNSTTLSFSKIETVPHHVQENVDSDSKLQSINVDGKGYYIVFHSSGEVEGEVETQEETVTIKFNETNVQDADVKQYTYYLTTGPEHDFIDVLLNGKPIPFDNATVGP